MDEVKLEARKIPRAKSFQKKKRQSERWRKMEKLLRV